MRRLLLATNNAGKIVEFQELLSGLPLEMVTPLQLGLSLEIDESGSTYRENARLKARTYADVCGLLTLADDSGLEVDALNGEPGIRSSRYAGPRAGDSEKVHYLLSRLENVPTARRTAHFRCVIALAWPEGKLVYRSGRCDGIITLSPRGTEGFGYDPIFLFPLLNKTMAELPPVLKNRISHRAVAARKVRPLLIEA